MSKELIEEMAEALRKCSCVYTDCDHRCSCCKNEELYDDTLLYIAQTLYNAGYRKQSENVTDINVGSKSDWISVEERLPESGVHCLLCCDIKCIDGTHRQYVCDGYYAERWKEGCCNVDDDAAIEYNEENDEYYLLEGWYEVIKNWDDYSSIAIDDTVTHWMPLPEAPKMKGGEE